MGIVFLSLNTDKEMGVESIISNIELHGDAKEYILVDRKNMGCRSFFGTKDKLDWNFGMWDFLKIGR